MKLFEILPGLLLTCCGAALPVQESALVANDLPVQPDPVHAVAVSPDGNRVAAGHRSGRVELLDAADGSLQVELQPGLSDRAWGLAFSPDGSMLAGVGFDGELCLWPLGAPGSPESRAPGRRRHDGLPRGEEGRATCLCVAWSPKSDRLALAGPGGHTTLWTRDGTRVAEWYSARPRSGPEVIWSGDGSFFVSANGPVVELRDGESGARLPESSGLREIRCPERLVSLDLHPDGTSLATGHSGCRLALWDLESGECVREARFPDPDFPEPDARINSIAFSPSGEHLAISSGEDAWVYVVDPETLGQRWTSGHLGYQYGIDVPVGWSPGDARLWFRKWTNGGGNRYRPGLHCVDFASPGRRSVCVGGTKLPIFGGDRGAIIDRRKVQLVDGEGRRLWGTGTVEPARKPPGAGERVERMESDESERPQRMDFFGASVVGLGDLDGDGFPECLVGAPEDSKSGDSAGSAWVFSGKEGELLHRLEAGSRKRCFGHSVCRLDDVNGDGVTDFAAGTWASGPPEAGYARVFSGKDGARLLQLTGGRAAPRFGRSVRPAGDVNGDGVPDLSVGYGTGGPKSGLQVHSGADGRLLHRLANTVRGLQQYGPGAGFGVGDVDGDDCDELLVLASSEASHCGYVYSVRRAAPIVSLPGSIPGDLWGPTADLVGDLDGDGHRDVVICCMVHYDEGESWTRVHSTGTGELLLDLTGRSRYAWGPAVACAGDVDADGTLDIVLGDLSFLTDGAVAVFSGKDGRVLHDLRGQHALAMLGCSVGAAGDVDRDGHDDFLVGIVNEWAPFQAGRVRIYSGRDASVIRQLSLDEIRSGE